MTETVEAKHTPGPWGLSHMDKKRARVSGGGWTYFCKVVVRLNGAVGNSIEGVANAHLIAAAPEMYEALKAVRAHMPDYPDTIWQGVDEAIAKAEAR